MNRSLVLALAPFTALLLVHCSLPDPGAHTSASEPPARTDGPDASAPAPLLGDGLTEEQDTLAAASPSSMVTPADVVLPNGKKLSEYAAARGLAAALAKGIAGHAIETAPQPDSVTGPQQRKNDLIMTMELRGLQLTNRDIWVYPAEGANRPAQDGSPSAYRKGLLYVWGGTSPEARTAGSAAGGTCAEELHGVDCSGLLYQLAGYAGISLGDAPAGTRRSAYFADPKTWSDAFPKSWGLEMQVVKAGEAPETGDIAYWPGHIGFVTVEPAGTMVIQSNGGQTKTCTENAHERRGPRTVPLAEVNGWFGGAQPKLLRIVATVAGDWDFQLRCRGEQADAAKVRMKIAPKGGPFEAMGSGTDYDGSPLQIRIAGRYDQTANLLTGSVFPTGDRSDSFSIKLLEDDTGYFGLAKVQDNGACSAEGRLVRVDVDAKP